jgi:hypothetical protein
MSRLSLLPSALAVVIGLFSTIPLTAQESDAGFVVEVEPASLSLNPGDEVTLKATVRDDAGNEVERGVVFFGLQPDAFQLARGIAVDRNTGDVKAHDGGQFRVFAVLIDEAGGFGMNSPRAEVPVTVAYPAVSRLEMQGVGDDLFVGDVVRPRVVVWAENGAERKDLEPELASSDDAVLGPDMFGRYVARTPGHAVLSAEAEGMAIDHRIQVYSNPVRRLELSADADAARTGDVVYFEVTARDADERPVVGAPIRFSVQHEPVDTVIAGAASAEVDDQGRFVAEVPGVYTVFATSGAAAAAASVRIEQRDVTQDVDVLGMGQVNHVHSSDLWVWEGADGRDYAVTGTWGGEGVAYFWDVTDPAAIVKIDSIQVDARTVNDVKISEDGRVGVISREGASTRRNGLVILDVSDPSNVSIISEFDDELTGGVHNVFIYDRHIYAVNNGQRYDIINIEDPARPYRVGRFELDTPGHAVHDVWVVDGIAYSSNWSDGVVMVDVGAGVAGGTVSNPVQISSYKHPTLRNHAAFPFWSQSTDRFYVIAGDEIFPGGIGDDKTPVTTAGYIHFIDFTDLDNPEEVARYEVPGAGSHNFWVEGDRLYIAYYNGGLRVVDISGELKGDLYRQGREIAHYLSFDPEGYIPNAPMTWGPQPHKGILFFSDWNSGLWGVRLQPREGLVP